MHSNLLPSEVIAKADGKNDIGQSKAEEAAQSLYTGDAETDSELTGKVIYSLGDYENTPVYSYVVGIHATSKDKFISEIVLVNAENGTVIAKASNAAPNMVKAKGVNELGDSVDLEVNYGLVPNTGSLYLLPYFTYEMHHTKRHVLMREDTMIDNSRITSITNTWEDPEAVSAYSNMCEILLWWQDRFSRNSLDDKGGTVNVYIHSQMLMGEDLKFWEWNTIEDNAPLESFWDFGKFCTMDKTVRLNHRRKKGVRIFTLR